MPICILHTALLLFSLWAPAQTQSGVPRIIKFSGQLTNAADRGLNGVQGITFAIYSAPTGGAPLWQETQNVQLAAGRYTVHLGSARELPNQLFSSEEPRWLGVRLLQP